MSEALLVLAFLLALVVVVPVVGVFSGVYLAVLHVAQYLLAMVDTLLRDPLPPRAHSSPGDPAWRQYFYGQAASDLARTVRTWRSLGQEAAEELSERISAIQSGPPPNPSVGRGAPPGQSLDLSSYPWLEPSESSSASSSLTGEGLLLRLIRWLALLIGWTVGTVLTSAVIVIHATVTVALGVLAWAAVPILRIADGAVLRARRIHMNCPACYRPIPYPVYACPSGCGRRHRDIRPGRNGVFRRACQCGRRMRTSLLLGSHRYEAYCPHCDHQLANGTGTARELVIAALGPAGAGKTRLLVLMTNALARLQDRPDIGLFASSSTGTWYHEHLPRIMIDEEIPATPDVSPRVLSFHVKSPRGRARLVHVFDTAGHRFDTAEGMKELGYLHQATSLMIVVDPLSIDSLWTELPPAVRERLADHRQAVLPPPMLSFDRTLRHLQALGIATRRMRVGLAITKADLVGKYTSLGHSTADNDLVQQWLAELGLGNLARSARHHLGQVRFFFTAAAFDQAGKPDGAVVSLMRWVFPSGGPTR